MFTNIKNHKQNKTVIKVIGLGGGGCNAITRIYESTDDETLAKVVCIAANTDAQHLENCPASSIIQLGPQLTQGLGAGSKPEIGEQATLESQEQIEECLEDTDMAIITASLGGGTGTGSAPVVAKIARNKGILVVGIVTLPFHFEGTRRWDNAISGLKELEKTVNTLIVVRNENLLSIYRQKKENASVEKVLYHADEVLRDGVNGFTGLIHSSHRIHVDFSDIVSALKDGGLAIMGIGEASGQNATIDATQQALNSPLLGRDNIEGAKQLLLHATVGKKGSMKAVKDASAFLTNQVDNGDHVNIKFGLKCQHDLEEDTVQIIVIATGFEENLSTFERSNAFQQKEKESSKRPNFGYFKKTSKQPSTSIKENIFSSEAKYLSQSKPVDTEPLHKKDNNFQHKIFSEPRSYEKKKPNIPFKNIEEEPAIARRSQYVPETE